MIEIADIFQTLNERPSFNARKKALEEIGFRKLGEGSGRTVFELDENRIIKIAKNPKGLAQNEVEANLSPTSSFFAKVLREGEEDAWLMCQNAKRITRTNFKLLTGMEFSSFSFMIKQYGAELRNSFWVDGVLDRDESSSVESNPFFLGVIELLAEDELSSGDLARINSYGCINDRVVIIDYGLTHEVFQRFYKKNKKDSSSW